MDPRGLSTTDVVRLVEAVDILLKSGSLGDLTAVRTESLLRLIGRASREQLAAVVARPELRTMAIGEFVTRIPDRFRPDRAAGLVVVVHVQLTGAADERLQIVIAGGTCSAGTTLDREPDVTLTADPVDLMRATTGKLTATGLVLRGRIVPRGDPRLALRAALAFDI